MSSPNNSHNSDDREDQSLHLMRGALEIKKKKFELQQSQAQWEQAAKEAEARKAIIQMNMMRNDAIQELRTKYPNMTQEEIDAIVGEPMSFPVAQKPGKPGTDLNSQTSIGPPTSIIAVQHQPETNSDSENSNSFKDAISEEPGNLKNDNDYIHYDSDSDYDVSSGKASAAKKKKEIAVRSSSSESEEEESNVEYASAVEKNNNKLKKKRKKH